MYDEDKDTSSPVSGKFKIGAALQVTGGQKN